MNMEIGKKLIEIDSFDGFHARLEHGFDKSRCVVDLIKARAYAVEEFNQIINFCAQLTNNYDESHDVMHHITVYKYAMVIFDKLNVAQWISKTISTTDYNDLLEMITYSTLLHDTIDHKYPVDLEIKMQKLDDFLAQKLDRATDVKWIIDNISYSKEVKFGYPSHPNNLVQLARDIVSDADKLDAIGMLGIERCKKFTIAFNPETTDDDEIMSLVIEHCHEKLLKLKDDFIRTVPGKQMAEAKQLEMIEFINSYKPINN